MGYWVADLVGTASRSRWSPESLGVVLARLGSVTQASSGGIWVGDQSAQWVASPPRSPGPELLEFRSDCQPADSGNWWEDLAHVPVEVVLEIDQHSTCSEHLIDIVGRLILRAVLCAEPVSDAQLRAELLKLQMEDVRSEHHAVGLLSERFQTSVDEGHRRLRHTAERFQISVTGFAGQLIHSGHQVALEPGYRSSNMSG